VSDLRASTGRRTSRVVGLWKCGKNTHGVTAPAIMAGLRKFLNLLTREVGTSGRRDLLEERPAKIWRLTRPLSSCSITTDSKT
jgi:hypothetical protein